MRRHTIEVTERELRIILTAFDILRDEGGPLPDGPWQRWTTGSYDALYERLLHLGEKGTAA